MKLFKHVSDLFNEGYHDLTTRMVFVISLFVILPIILITFFSTRYLESQFNKNQDQYLRSTLTMALSEMQQRQLDIQRSALVPVSYTHLDQFQNHFPNGGGALQ